MQLYTKQITGQHVQSVVNTGNMTMPAHAHLVVHAQEEHSSKTREAASEQPTDTTVAARSLQHIKTPGQEPSQTAGGISDATGKAERPWS